MFSNRARSGAVAIPRKGTACPKITFCNYSVVCGYCIEITNKALYKNNSDAISNYVTST